MDVQDFSAVMRMGRLQLPAIDARFVVPGMLACLFLFGGGLALGTATGGSTAAPTTETFTTAFTSQGREVTVTHVRTHRLPASTVTRRRRVIRVQTATVDQTTSVPTTLFLPETFTHTAVSTKTVQLPPTTSTATVTVTSTVTASS